MAENEDYTDSNPYFQEKKFIDLAEGREGIFIDKKRVKVRQNKNIPHGYRVVWIDDSDALTSLTKIPKMITGSSSIVNITDVIYPKNALIERTNPSDAEGAHELEVVALETVDNGAPWIKSLYDEINESITELEEEMQQAEAGKLSEVAANLGNEGSSRVAESSDLPRRKGRGRRRRRKSDDDDRGNSRSSKNDR